MPAFNFDSSTTRFNLTNALQLAEASQLAYEKTWQAVEKRTQEWGFTVFRSFDVSGTEAFLASNDQMAILAFRGTQDIEDWLTDLKAKFVETSAGRVHQGFHQGIEVVWPDVMKAIDQQCCQGQKLWVTGHSLGAALATLAVSRLLEKNREIAGLYTFGSPRVGDKAFAKRFDAAFKSRTFRFINNEDVVTLVPPQLAGYRHVGQSRYFDNDGTLHSDVGWWKMAWDLWQSFTIRSSEESKTLKAQYPNGIQDHDIQRYINLIRKNLAGKDGL